MSPDANRPFDVILWGATGFVGRLTAEYLAHHYPPGELRWAIAGRSRERLEALRDALAAIRPELAELAVLTGDSHDRQSLDAMASRTRVICTTVGPYERYGSELVAACVAHGTHYCDLTGEAQWIRRMIDAHHQEAAAVGARIVMSCGFDSIPSDLGTLLLERAAIERFGAPATTVRLVVWSLRGGLSGGTLASMSTALEQAGRDPAVRAVFADPYALAPDGERHGPAQDFQAGVRFDRHARVWTAPFAMAAVNEKVVRRTNALLGHPYGRDFRYGEASRTGEGARGAVKAGAMTAGMGAFAAAMSLRPTRRLLERFVLPAPGEGPSRDTIERGRFTMRLFGRGTAADGTPFAIEAEVGADRDPGYGATAIMLAESALALARDEADDTALPGGILTPASALGMALVERLRAAGMRFEVR